MAASIVGKYILEPAVAVCALVAASFVTILTTVDDDLVDRIFLERDPDRLARVLAVCNAGYGSCLSAEAHDFDAELARVEHLVLSTAALSALAAAGNHAAAEEFEVQGVFAHNPDRVLRVLDICAAGYGVGVRAEASDVDAELARLEHLIVLDTNLEKIAAAGSGETVARMRAQPWTPLSPEYPGVLTCEGCFGVDTFRIVSGDAAESARLEALVQAEDSLDALIRAENYGAYEHLRTRGWFMLAPDRAARVVKICDAGLGTQLNSKTGDFNAELARLER